MVMAADLSVRLGTLDAHDQKRIVALVKAAGLPVQAPDLGLARWMDLMEVDKKNEGGEIKFILLKPMGSAYITSVPSEILQETLKACV
jgi:3-dehydroquinate synthase